MKNRFMKGAALGLAILTLSVLAWSQGVFTSLGPNSTQQHQIPVVAADTFTLNAATQTLTNKTLTSPVLNGATVNTTVISLLGNKAQLTSDFTSANASGLQLITGLSFSLPATYSGNLSFHCGLQFSQATPVAGDQFGVALLTTAPTRMDAEAIAATNTTAFTEGPLTNLTTTTPTAIVTFTEVASTKVPAFIDGTVQVAGSGAATLQFYVTNGTAGDVIVVGAGSYCSII